MCDKNAREDWECWLTKAEEENIFFFFFFLRSKEEENMSLRESEAEKNEWLRENELGYLGSVWIELIFTETEN